MNLARTSESIGEILSVASQQAEIISDPNIMLGKPVIKGTRITLLEAYPHITREGILAALGFAAKALRADVIYPVAS